MWLCHDGEISSVIFVIFKRRGTGGSVMYTSLGCTVRVGVYSPTTVLCGSPAVVCPFSMSNVEEL